MHIFSFYFIYYTKAISKITGAAGENEKSQNIQTHNYTHNTKPAAPSERSEGGVIAYVILYDRTFDI